MCGIETMKLLWCVKDESSRGGYHIHFYFIPHLKNLIKIHITIETMTALTFLSVYYYSETTVSHATYNLYLSSHITHTKALLGDFIIL